MRYLTVEMLGIKSMTDKAIIYPPFLFISHSTLEITKMNDKTISLSPLLELLKYPVLAFSILMLLLGVRYWVGMEFGLVTELSTNGIKFEKNVEKTDGTFNIVTNLEGRLNKVEVEIEEIKKVLPKNSNFVVSAAQILEATETVSDQTASVENINGGSPEKGAELVRGYIWIGGYDNEGWHNPRLAYKDTVQPIEGDPKRLKSGTEYQVLGNMVLREGLPENSAKYYKDIKSLGVVPRGTVVRLMGEPKEIERGGRNPYWVSVEVPKKETK